MLYYLDTVIVIYAVEGNPANQQRALNHLAALEQAGHQCTSTSERSLNVWSPSSDQATAEPQVDHPLEAVSVRSEQRPQSVLVTRANPPNLVGDATMIFGLDVARTLYNDQATRRPTGH